MLRAAADLAKARKLSDLERQGLIQAFEFTHELAWNTLKDFLESRGAVELYGSRDFTREAFARELISNGDEWMAMIANRNRSSHTYNEKTANEMADAILSSFVGEFEVFLARFADLEGGAVTAHGLPEDTVEQISSVLRTFPAIERALLFGSRAKGTHRPGSDIDLALVGRALDWRAIGRVVDALEELLLPYRSSLIVYDETTDPAVAAHIARVGVPLFERRIPARMLRSEP